MKGLFTIYREKIGNRFFLRLMTIYSVIIVVIISVVAALIAKAVKDALTEQAIYHNMQVLETINARFNQQNRNFKKILSGLYMGAVKGGPDGGLAVSAVEKLFDQELSDGLTFSEELDIRRELDTFLMENSLPIDTDILLISPSRQILNVSRQSYGTRYYERIARVISEGAADNINERRVWFLSADELGGEGGKPPVYVIFDYIRKAEDTSKYSGVLAAVYNPGMIKSAYNQFSPYLLGTS